MNPADHINLSAQMSLLEQHDNTLKALMEHMKEFSISLASLRTQVINTTATDNISAPSAAPSLVLPPPTRDVFVPPPAPYHGNLGSSKRLNSRQARPPFRTA
uniref:Uncharacterized protein n=1 Tax=Knipowitschia caucasica TaxID=637954 RepID=A0AAV2JZ65_KNICA